MTTFNFEAGILDDVSWRILEELQRDARISFSELGRRVGLSSPAVAERVRRLEEVGVIEGYQARINLASIGLTMTVVIRVSTYDNHASDKLAESVQHIPEIIECHKVTGDDCYIMKAAVSSVQHLEKLLDLLKQKYCNRITTSIVLSSPVEQRMITHDGD
jgi:Lrp/AsnC family leucine-responsive transcriptional regulator